MPPAPSVALQGTGPAESLQIQSLQPQIVGNLGVAVDFSIIGLILDAGPEQPGALEATIGELLPNATAEVRFLITSDRPVRRQPATLSVFIQMATWVERHYASL